MTCDKMVDLTALHNVFSRLPKSVSGAQRHELQPCSPVWYTHIIGVGEVRAIISAVLVTGVASDW